MLLMQPASNPRHSPYDMRKRNSSAHLFVHLCVKSDNLGRILYILYPPVHAFNPKSTLTGEIWLLYPIKLLKLKIYDMVEVSVALKGIWLPESSYSTCSRAEAGGRQPNPLLTSGWWKQSGIDCPHIICRGHPISIYILLRLRIVV
jgi:hypothetical protein